VLELAVGADNGVGVHYEVLGQLADGGELVAFTECSCLYGVLDLLHELEVEGDAGGRVELEDQSVLVYRHTTHMRRTCQGLTVGSVSFGVGDEASGSEVLDGPDVG